MKWHDYQCYYKTIANAYNLRGDAREVIDKLLRAIRPDIDREKSASVRVTLSTENVWLSRGRPYYDLYPSVTEAFTKVNLEKVKFSQLNLPISVLIRMKEGYELKSSVFSCGCFLVGYKQSDGMSVLSRSGQELIAFVLDTKRDWDVSTTLHDFKFKNADQKDNESFHEIATKILKIVCTIGLLHDNPDIIEPLPLEADAAKFEAATDFETRQKLIDKAKRRGKIGWAIGKRIEVAAGFRHPHFAIRWMGHGEPKTAVLRPIKGCIVNRAKLAEVPTGYLDDLVPIMTGKDNDV